MKGQGKGLVYEIFRHFEKEERFTLKDAYRAVPDKSKETIRARIYEHLGVMFRRIGKGVYAAIQDGCTCVIMEGDGRDLSMLEDGSIDCIITDHPWLDMAANKGGNRSFSQYPCFRYTVEDFREKARVLKDGSFLAEFIPAENGSNFQYLFELKKMAQECGFEYYCKVEWKKGTFTSNTGRKAKNTQDIMIFTKGKARCMRLDVKNSRVAGKERFMSGSSGMLPAMFDVEPVPRSRKVHQSELPVSLCEQLLGYLTKEGEVILDQFAGSDSIGVAAIRQKRSCILIESVHEYVGNIIKRLEGMGMTGSYIPARQNGGKGYVI